MQLLPDEFFSLSAVVDTETTLNRSVEGALSLPPQLKVKWLRSDCMSELDLSNPGGGWGLARWRELALCMHAVPSLQKLTVKLPRYTAVTKANPAAATAPLRSRTCSSCMRSGSLHFYCSLCRYCSTLEQPFDCVDCTPTVESPDSPA